MKKFRQPFGVQDYLSDECYNKELLEKTVSNVFYNAGFEKVKTGALEYYDLYEDKLSSERKKRLFKLTDTDGSLLVLRPDITMQIARMASAKLDLTKLHKLYYVENSYEYLPESQRGSSRTREFPQAGIEILGASSIEGDIEAIILAIESLLAVGLKDFLIEIGNVDVFNGLLFSSGLSQSDASMLKKLTNNKDALGIEIFLKDKQLNEKTALALNELSSFYGDKSVLDRAEKICDNDISSAAIERLRETINAIENAGYGDYVSIDLGLLKGRYYTGLVMRGIVKNLGASILDGGRYDQLSKSYSGDDCCPAVGFALGVKRLLIALERQKSLSKIKSCDFAYTNTAKFSAIEQQKISEIKQEKLRAIKLYNTTENALIDYCIENCIGSAIVFSESDFKEIDIESIKRG